MHTRSSFKSLVSLRTRVRFILAGALIAAHAFFVGGIAFYRDFFAQPISEGSTLTVGIVATVGVILTMILLEWIYIFISQKWLDPLQKEIVENEILQSGTREKTEMQQ